MVELLNTLEDAIAQAQETTETRKGRSKSKVKPRNPYLPKLRSLIPMTEVTI